MTGDSADYERGWARGWERGYEAGRAYAPSRDDLVRAILALYDKPAAPWPDDDTDAGYLAGREKWAADFEGPGQWRTQADTAQAGHCAGCGRAADPDAPTEGPHA